MATPGSRSGKFSSEEDSQIKHILEDFKIREGVSDEELCPQLREATVKVKKYSVFKEMYDTMPSRTPKSIHARTMRLILENNTDTNHRGKWSGEDQDRLKQYQQLHGNSWSAIGRLMGRHGNACRDQMKLLTEREARTLSGRFTSEEENQLIQAVLKVCNVNNMSSVPLKKIPFKLIAQEMLNKRSYVDYQRKWPLLLNKYKGTGAAISISGAGEDVNAVVYDESSDSDASDDDMIGQRNRLSGKSKSSRDLKSMLLLCYMHKHNIKYERSVVWADLNRLLGVSRSARKWEMLVKGLDGNRGLMDGSDNEDGEDGDGVGKHVRQLMKFHRAKLEQMDVRAKLDALERDSDIMVPDGQVRPPTMMSQHPAPIPVSVPAIVQGPADIMISPFPTGGTLSENKRAYDEALFPGDDEDKRQKVGDQI